LPNSIDQAVLIALANDLSSAQGRSVIVAGEHHAPEVHAACHAVNEYLGNIGTTVKVHPPVLPMPTNQGSDLSRLVAELQGGGVQTLMMLGGNPVYSAPADYQFGELVSKVPVTFYLGTHFDETAERCQYQMPVSHFLEAWGD